MSETPTTVAALLQRADPQAIALLDLDGGSLSYGALADRVRGLAGQLRASGIGPDDRVALVLPNGPEMAVAFLAVASCAAAAPLNPAYRADEFEFYLDDLQPKALLTMPGFGDEARTKLSANASVLEIEGDLGSMRIGSLPTSEAVLPEADPNATALLLHTSGTTSRPKLVALTQRNIASSADNIAGWLELTSDDRCLNVMPLFHIHGLIAGVLASLAGSSSLVATSGFDAFRFFNWWETFTPSWYTAVPTMHQLLLQRARRHQALLEAHPPRFIRSSSASLPPSVMADLESTFGAPVVEAYGMTEASHQMTSNPIPPGERQAGSVGLPAGASARIVGVDGAVLPVGDRGEVQVQGAGITAGYIGNPEATADAFDGDWFKTGDEGFLSDAGYLTLTGRLKELINRGGEKISPLEIDDLLLQHPAVAQAVAFAVPHPTLGEDVAAAIVPVEGEQPDPAEVRAYIAERVAPFKVPRTIVVLEDIPKGPTGKLQRIGLAARLGLT